MENSNKNSTIMKKTSNNILLAALIAASLAGIAIMVALKVMAG
jgi:hypothetical protein